MIFRFHEYTLNSATRTLFYDGDIVKLQPKVMDLLLVLIENRSRFVSKPELYEHLWGTVHVGSASLVRLVREIRRALRDDGANPTIIRTLHSRGYQFIAPDLSIEEDDEPAAERNDEGRSTRRTWHAVLLHDRAAH